MPAYTISVNDQRRSVSVSPDTPLLWVLRDSLGLTGTKFGCGIGQCGACTIHLDDRPVRSCSLPIAAVGVQRVTTIEALGGSPLGKALQAAWIDEQVPQCGYCQSGQLMAAASLLRRTRVPTDADIDGAMTNICRCGTYVRIRAAIHRAVSSDGR